MTKHYEIDSTVAYTKCPCCQADIEVRERYEWGYFNGRYEVVPAGSPNERISSTEYRKTLDSQKPNVYNSEEHENS